MNETSLILHPSSKRDNSDKTSVLKDHSSIIPNDQSTTLTNGTKASDDDTDGSENKNTKGGLNLQNNSIDSMSDCIYKNKRLFSSTIISATTSSYQGNTNV